MSKERSQRRAEREREAAIVAAAKAAEAERKERRDARVQAMTSWVPKRRNRPSGILAERQRTQTRLVVLVVVVLNILLWLASGDGALRALGLLLSVLIAPLLLILLNRK